MTQPLPTSVRAGYGLGSVATGSFGTVPGLLLLPYLTDTLGISAIAAGFIVFAPKAWDIVLNPIAGQISDRSRSPAGRRRPFLVRAGLLLAVCFMVMFAGPTGPPLLAGIWVVIAFTACASAYAFFQVPYISMPAEMTLDYRERTRLMTWRVIVLALAILVSGGTAPAIVNAFGGQSTALGYRWMGVFVAVLLAIGALAAWKGTAGAPEHSVATSVGGLREQLRIVGSSSDFRAVLGTFIVQAIAVGAMLAGVAYVSRDIMGHPSAATWLFVAFVGPAVVVTPLWDLFATRFGKRSGYMAASMFLLIGAVTIWGTGAYDNGKVYIAASIVGVGYAGAQVFPMAMLPDVAAEDARHSGHNRIGVFTGVWTAGETLGLALGPGLYAVVLAIGGYVSSAGHQVTQPDSALSAIMLGFSLVPAALIAVSVLILRGYRLDQVLKKE